MNIVNIKDVYVAAERLSDQLQLLILSAYLVDQHFALLFHLEEQVLKEGRLIVYPCCLVSYLPDGGCIRVRNEQDVINTALRLQICQRIYRLTRVLVSFLIDITQSEPLLR